MHQIIELWILHIKPQCADWRGVCRSKHLPGILCTSRDNFSGYILGKIFYNQIVCVMCDPNIPKMGIETGAMRSLGRIMEHCKSTSFENFVWGSNLALFFFEAMQSRPLAIFPESCHDYPEQYFGSFDWGMCLSGSLKRRYWQNCDINK